MTFPTAEDARQFLIDKISYEAEVQGIRLAGAERRMLQLNLDEPESATGIPLALLQDESREFETRIVALLRAAYLRAEDNQFEQQSFHHALERLKGTNHYLLVVAAEALQRPEGVFGFVLLIVLVLAAAAAAVVYAIARGK